MTKDARLQLRIERDLLKRAKKMARQNGTTLSHVVSQYLRALLDENASKIKDEDGVRQI